MNRYTLSNLIITAPNCWKDITEAVGGDNVPFTLAKDDGKGAMQFSIAEYKSGKDPHVTLSDLDRLLTSFADSRKFDVPFDESRLTGLIISSAASYNAENDFIRIWYCSDGKSIVLCTYVSEWGAQGAEPDECNEIIEMLQVKAVKE